MKKTAIVTLADTNYFELLVELIDSIKRFEKNNEIAICVLDAGLDNNQKKFLLNKVDVIKPAVWDFEVPNFKVRGKEWLKSQVSRAFLPKYFPGYNKYLWIDADAWVNKWEAIDLYFKASDKNRLAISTSADRAYGRVLRAEWLFGGWAKIKSQNYKHAKSSGFSEDDARKVALMPHLNIGVFCLNENAPHWKIWQKNLKKALSSGKIFGSEQIAMNISVYVDNVEIDILPAYCNWTLIDKLKFDVKKQSFVEPYTPNHEIGIVHLAGKNNDDSRKNKNFLRNVETLDGEIIKKSVRFGQ